jgi:photosystem II stability/assembly factor-like uncharacterized protein
MTPKDELENLYLQARAALKAKDYPRTSELLQKILVEDENYKDASRLLAQAVKLKRRRWYNHPLLWGGVGAAALVVLGIFLAPLMKGLFASPIVQTLEPADTATPIPLAWKRISMGQEFPRDIVTSIVTNPVDTDVVFVGMANAGIYKSINGGGSWSPAFHGINNTNIDPNDGFLKIDPENPQVLYVEPRFDSLYKTSDGGDNWTYANFIIERIAAQLGLLLDPQNSSHLFAWVNGDYYESTDTGQTWTLNYQGGETDCPGSFGNIAGIDRTANQMIIYIFAGSPSYSCLGGLFQSIDNGHTWTRTGVNPMRGASLVIVKDEQNNTVLYTNEGDDSLYISFDNGMTWQYDPVTKCNPVAIDPESPATVYCLVGDKYILQTESGGRVWSKFGVEFNFGSITSINIAHDSDGIRIALGTTEGLYTSVENGNSWQPQNNGLGATNLQLRFDPADSTVMYVDVQSNNDSGCSLYRSLDTGKSWEWILDGSSCEPEFDTQDKLYVVQDGTIVRSSNRGATWYPVPIPPHVFITWVNTNSNAPGWIFAGDASQHPYVYYSTDSGQSWQNSTGMEWMEERNWNVRLFFDALGKQAYALQTQNIYHSEDGGQSWSSCASIDSMGFATSDSGSDSSLVVDPRNGNRIFLAMKSGLQSGLYISEDGCQSWRRSRDLASLFVNSIALNPNNPDTLYAGTDGGAYISYDGGENWGQVNDGLLGATVVYSIAVDQDGNVYAATPYGIFKLENKQ